MASRAVWRQRSSAFIFQPHGASIRSDWNGRSGDCTEPAMLTAMKHQESASSLPFDRHLLDLLMDEELVARLTRE